jgi:ATP-dependent helicase/nuclease subunit A
MSGITPPRELVLASAGSGKTYRISSRLIGLLATGADPDQILASSFTRKAAGQILDRTLGRIAAAVLDPRSAAELAVHATLDPRHPPSPDRASWASLLERTARVLHRLNVGTLDAFMVRAAGNFEAELGLPPGWRIADQTDEERLASRALSSLLASVDRQRLLRLLGLSSGGEAGRSIHDRLVGMMSELIAVEEGLDPDSADPWGAFRRMGTARLPSIAERERLADAIRAVTIPRYQNGAESLAWRKAVERLADGVATGSWEMVASSKLCERVVAGELTYYRLRIGPEMCAVVGEALALARGALRDVLASKVEAFGELTRFYDASFRSLQRESGTYGFGDITRLIGSGDPLGNRADLYYRLDGQTRHILLDEFQDTSIRQWQALEPLLDEVLTDDGRAAVIVADPKQSIYAWRGAEPALVHAVADRYALANDHLAVSWRSSQIVLDFVNTVFGDIASHPLMVGDDLRRRVAATWGADFHPHTAQHKELPGYVTLELGPDDEGSGGSRPLLCEHAARRTAELHSAAPGFSIGVLTRTNATVARIFLELKNLGVMVSQEGGNPLTDSAACEAVLALVRLADHPGDSIAAYHVARSPLGQIVQLDDHTKLEEVRRVSQRIRTRLLDEGYGRTITDIGRRIAPWCDARDARRLSQLAELAHRYDATATLRPSDFNRLVEVTRVEDPASADVRVMTVHQAKGLEFDIVVLPELGTSIEGRGSSPAVLPFRATETGSIQAVMPMASHSIRALFPEIARAHQQRRAAGWRDELSGLYVALTRARYAVHAIVAPKSLSTAGKAVTPAAIIATAVGVGNAPPGAQPRDFLYAKGFRAWYRNPAAKAENGQPAPAPKPPAELRVRVESTGRLRAHQTPSQLHAAARIDVANLLRMDTAEAKDRGTLIHAWFEQIRWIEEGVPDEVALLRIGRQVAPHLSAAVVDATLTDFHRWITTGAIRSALSRSRYAGDALVERELPFVDRRDQVFMEGVIDRLVLRREQGRVVEAEILDYKSNRISPEQVAEAAADYRPQLDAYTRAVATMYGIPLDRCTATLIFLEPARVATVSGLERRTEPSPVA